MFSIPLMIQWAARNFFPSKMSEKISKIYEIKKSHPENISAACFEQDYYDSLSPALQERFLKCLNSGIENPDSSVGCYACQPDDYDVFKPYFVKVLQAYHKVDLSKTRHVNNWSLEGVPELPPGGNLDLAELGLPETSMRVRTGRNLKRFPLPGSMTKQDRIDLEVAMGKVFEKLYQMPKFGGHYYSITPGHPNFIDTAKYNQLVKDHLMFKDMSSDSYLVAAGISDEWPYGRGCYVSDDRNLIIWVGEEDHLRIISMKKGFNLNEVFNNLKAALDEIENLIEGGCAFSDEFGVVTSCPTNIGTAMRASIHIKIPKLTADGTDKKAKDICKPLGLSVRGIGGEHTPIGADGTIDISPSARFCISEAEIVIALYKGIKLLMEAESKA